MAANQAGSLGELLEERSRVQDEANLSGGVSDPGPVTPSVARPPGMQRAQDKSVDELLKEMNRIPLFMTSLDEGDGEGGENIQLEALKALAYEGTRAEIAANFREQGNELVRFEKRYTEAREFYTKALQALKAPPPEPDPEHGAQVIEIDEEAEEKKERSIEEACLVNRALCNLEMKNYGSCNRDCASALRLNPKNVKAWYRAASACLALDKAAEAQDACESGLQHEPRNAALSALRTKIQRRTEQLAREQAAREQRAARLQLERQTLRTALEQRNIPTRTTDRPPEIPEAAVGLEDSTDASSTLSLPVMLLYPLHAQTDFIKAFREQEAVAEHLAYVLPPPWDEGAEYVPEKVDCYMETVKGGLVKVGKKVSLLKLLGSGQVEVVDGLVKINVLPKLKAAGWIEEVKARKARA